MSSDELRPIAPMILSHHERWDGKGYPEKLSGTGIPVLSRIICIVDSYDAMVNDRAYRKALTPEAAQEEIRRNAGAQFDPYLAYEFLLMLEENHGVSIDKWLFYQDESVMPNRYALVVESDADVDWDGCVDELEDYMGRCNKRYTGQRAKHFISRLVVLRQQAGTHDAWAQRCLELGASVAQIKPVHSLDTPEKRAFFLSRIAPEK